MGGFCKIFGRFAYVVFGMAVTKIDMATNAIVSEETMPFRFDDIFFADDDLIITDVMAKWKKAGKEKNVNEPIFMDGCMLYSFSNASGIVQKNLANGIQKNILGSNGKTMHPNMYHEGNIYSASGVFSDKGKLLQNYINITNKSVDSYGEYYMEKDRYIWSKYRTCETFSMQKNKISKNVIINAGDNFSFEAYFCTMDNSGIPDWSIMEKLETKKITGGYELNTESITGKFCIVLFSNGLMDTGKSSNIVVDRNNIPAFDGIACSKSQQKSVVVTVWGAMMPIKQYANNNHNPKGLIQYLKVVLAAILVLSPFISGISKAVQPELPLLIGKPVFSTLNLAGVTNDYVVLKSPQQIRLLDVATGDDVDPSKFTDDGDVTSWSRIDADENSIKDIVVSTDRKTGKSMVYDEKCFVVSKERGIACKVEQIDDNNRLIAVWDINAQNEMWHFKTSFQIESMSPSNVVLIDDLMVFGISGNTTFYDLSTGVVKLVTKPLYIWRTKRWGKFLIMDNVLFDMEKLQIVYDGHNASLWFDNGLVYILPPPSDGKLEYASLDPTTMKFTHYSVSMPIAGGQPSYIWNGVKNGVMARWNAETDSFELLDCKTGEVLFTHENTYAHTSERTVIYNDRYAIIKDSAQIFCYDCKERRLAWTKDIATFTSSMGNGFYWQPEADDSIRVFKMLDPNRSVVVDAKKHHIFFPSNDCLFALNDTDMLVKFDWNGKKTVLPSFEGFGKKLRLPFVWKNAVYIWVEDESGKLIKFEKDFWNEVFTSESLAGSRASFGNGLLAFVKDKEYASVLDIDSMEVRSIKLDNVREIQFKSGYLLMNSRDGWTIFDLKTFGLLDNGIKDIIGGDTDSLYYAKDDYVYTLAPKEKRKFRMDWSSVTYFSASNGLFLFDSALVDSNGNPIQLLSSPLYKLTTINGKTYIFESTRNVNLFELSNAGSYSINNDEDMMIFRNTGENKITIKYWLVPFEGLVARYLEQPKSFVVNPGKVYSISRENAVDSLLIVESEAFFDQTNSGDGFKRKYEPAKYLGIKNIDNSSVINAFRIKARN